MRIVYSTGLSLLALVTSMPALAQSTTPSPTTTAPAGDAAAPATDDRQGDIIVTASKRAATLQDTPIAVSVTSAATIEQAQVRDLVDLQSLVPSLRVSQNQNSAATTFTIRGFGNGANNPGIEPSVGVFIDGVYRSRSAAQISDLPNIERVEVLRGPQSTLFGKNASAGVISVVTQKPQFDFGGSASATYGNYNTVVLKADVTGPISDTLAFSLGGNYNRRDGFYRVANQGNTAINNRNRYDVRAQLLFQPSSDLSVRLIGDYSKINERCCDAPNVLAGPTAAILTAVIGAPSVVANAPYATTINLNRLPENRIQNYGGSAQIDYDFGNLALTSITAYRKVKTHTSDDSDFTAAEIISQVGNTRIGTFTQEVRLASDFNGPVNFLVGGFYFDEKIDFNNDVILGRDARPYLNILSQGGLNTVESITGGAAAVGRTFFQAGQGTSDNFKFKNRAYSAFGTVDFKPTDRLTLTAGFNYTKDRKDVSSAVVTTEPFSAIDLVALGVRLGVPAPLANTAANPLLPLRALQFLPPFLNFPNAVESGKTRDGDFSYTLRAAYKLNRELNFYATYATGFKASSFNLSRDSRPSPADFIPGSPVSSPATSPIRAAGLASNNLTTGSRFAGPENAENFEIGIKGSFPRVSFNFAAFRQSIKGFQGNVFTGTGFVLSNAGKQTTQGFELEGTVTPVDPLTLSLAVTYLDAKFDSFVNSAVGDISGQKVAGVSPLSTSAGAAYTRKFDNGMKFILRGDYQFQSDTQVAQGLPGFVTTTNGVSNFANALAIGRRFKREVNEFNAAATLQLNNGLEVSVYGRNLSNNRYLTAIFDGVAQAGSVFGYRNQPRTYGASVRYKF
ncbi:TonB-dependent receptor [Sphingomonas sp. GB1N7]|uniref:TonB-dependent receptor n=1 Tax=Parasphingomonas caseinilytica TaxID=3096158 RepID=UPI002FC8AB4D